MLRPTPVLLDSEVKMPGKCTCLHFIRRTSNRFKILSVVLSFYVALIYINGKIRPTGIKSTRTYFNSEVLFMSDPKNHDIVIKNYFAQRQNWTTSNLGSILFKNANVSEYKRPGPEPRYKILIWKRYNFLSARHIVGFNGLRKDPFDDCSVNNCKVVGGDNHLSDADAVVVHLHTGALPHVETRPPKQRWIFLSDESPQFTFGVIRKSKQWESLANIFNWSMTYRFSSDIPVPYGRTVALTRPKISNLDDLKGIIPYWNNKETNKAAAILMSNCGGPRIKFVQMIRKHIDFDRFGFCFEHTDTCPGKFRKDCPRLNQYLFYFSFENSHCDEYITEKVFYNAYEKGAIPVILGPSLKNCATLLPPHSYLHVKQFSGISELVDKIKELHHDTDKLLEYHVWRIHFEVINEHGFFDSKSQHYCRICEALNYNDDKPKIYSAEILSNFLDPQKLCDKNVKIQYIQK